MTDSDFPPVEFHLDKLRLRLDVTLRAHLSAISPVVDRTLETVREMGCAREDEINVETALREALANAIVHGCGRDPGKSVQCSVMCEEGLGILVVVRDPGPGVSPESLPSPVHGQNLYSSHGRGIYMITRFMDEVKFARGGTEIYMRKRRGPALPPKTIP
jgi:serine/threonine-protein kinase RsbW